MQVLTLLRRPAARNRLILTVLWAAMWSIAAAVGIRFDTFGLDMWHFIDPVLLDTAPLQSLLHLHSQPPLFNMLLAAALAIFGDGHAIALYLLFSFMALATVLMTESLTRELTRSNAAALAAGAVLVLSPSFVLYGHALFYTFPTAFLAILGVWTARRAAIRQTLGSAAAFACVIAAAAWLWAVFHPIWVAATAAWFVWAMKGARGRAAAAMAIPLVLVAALVIKNGILFDVWGTSSWSGMNLARIATSQLVSAERKAAVKAGELSPLALTRPFAPLKHYRSLPDPAPTGVPILDRPTKSNSDRNLHHLKYIEISRGYMRDAVTVIRSRPMKYLESVAKGFWVLYLHPSSDFHIVDKQRALLGRHVAVYEAVLYGRPPGSKRPDISAGTRWLTWGSTVKSGLLLKLWFLAVLLGGPVWLVFLARAGRLREPDGIAATALIGSILHMTLACSLLEIGENQRFRFTIEPAAIIVAAVAITAAVRRLRSRANRAGS